jgi:hypothetical protein
MPRRKYNQDEQVDQLYSYYKGVKTSIPTDLWISDQLCHCKRWGYPDYKLLIQAELVWTDPPKCSKCDKYQNRMQKCSMCFQWFYYWFRHSRQGWHTKPRVGWYCWNCCERYYPPVVEPHALERFGFVPPPDEILPPGYELLVRTRASGNRGTTT